MIHLSRSLISFDVTKMLRKYRKILTNIRHIGNESSSASVIPILFLQVPSRQIAFNDRARKQKLAGLVVTRERVIRGS